MGVTRDQLPTLGRHSVYHGPACTGPARSRRRSGRQATWWLDPMPSNHCKLDIPLFVSDMSFGALSEPAKVALSKGAQLAGTGICSGEGGMLPEEQEANDRYFYELASGKVWLVSWDKLRKGPGLPFQGRPGRQDRHRRASAQVTRLWVRSPRCGALEEGEATLSPRRRFPDLDHEDDYRAIRRRGPRKASGGIPIGGQAVGPAHRGRHRRGPSGSGSTTSSSTVGAAGPGRRRCCSATTSRSRPSRRWPEPGAISISEGPAVTSPW